jgi:N6-L-threonylcarbamoyladenine synthase/protein kinase Bud32
MITSNGKILSNEKSVYKPKKGWGILPREAAEHHATYAVETIEKTLKNAKIKINNIDIIAFSQGPGLAPCLHVGASVARYLSLKLKKPLIGVNHMLAHVEIGKLTTNAKDPIIVYVSGANTMILTFIDGVYRILGETLDLPLGNAIDSLSRELDIEPPYGPNFDKVASKGKWIDLPYVVKGMDVSFSGLLTEAIRKFKNGIKKEDVCYSFQETCFSMITEVTERALAHTGKQEVLLTGGVAKAKRLQEMLKIMCEERNARFFVVPLEYASDNGTMIAWVGILKYKSGRSTSIRKSKINPKWRIDEVKISWN